MQRQWHFKLRLLAFKVHSKAAFYKWLFTSLHILIIGLMKPTYLLNQLVSAISKYCILRNYILSVFPFLFKGWNH